MCKMSFNFVLPSLLYPLQPQNKHIYNSCLSFLFCLSVCPCRSFSIPWGFRKAEYGCCTLTSVDQTRSFVVVTVLHWNWIMGGFTLLHCFPLFVREHRTGGGSKGASLALDSPPPPRPHKHTPRTKIPLTSWFFFLENVKNIRRSVPPLDVGAPCHGPPLWTSTFNMWLLSSNEPPPKNISPNVGLEPTTLGLRVPCSTDWANRAAMGHGDVQHCHKITLCNS